MVGANKEEEKRPLKYLENYGWGSNIFLGNLSSLIKVEAEEGILTTKTIIVEPKQQLKGKKI